MLEFIKKLLPRIEKTDILEDVRITKAEIDKTVIPSYQAGATYFKTNKPKSKEYEYLATIFFRNIDVKLTKRAVNVVSQINEALPNISKNLSYLETIVEEIMERDIIREGLTAKKSVIIKSISEIGMLSRFCIDLLDYIYIKESNLKLSENNEYSPEKETIIKNQIGVFARLITQYSLSLDKFKNIIDSYIDIVLNDKNIDVSKKVFSPMKDGNPFDGLDPELINHFTYSPIYFIKMNIATRQVARYREAEEKKRMLELRLLSLLNAAEGNPDLKIQKEIEYVQNRIERAESDLRKLES